MLERGLNYTSEKHVGFFSKLIVKYSFSIEKQNQKDFTQHFSPLFHMIKGHKYFEFVLSIMTIVNIICLFGKTQGKAEAYISCSTLIHQ